MDQLIEAAMNQNFVPVVDDRGIFIGIVRRQAIIRYCYDKARTEARRPRAPRMPAPRAALRREGKALTLSVKALRLCQLPRGGALGIAQGFFSLY
mgnify:CR=1 FL=1